MKNFSTRHWTLCAYSLFFLANITSEAQKILRITIAHKDTSYTWQGETINDLQTTIESIAASLLEAKSLDIKHSCEGNRVIFDISQHETRYMGEKLNSLLNNIKKITAIISHLIGNTVTHVMNIPHDIFIYYNPPTEVSESSVESIASVNVTHPIDCAPTAIDNINEPTTMIENITPVSSDLLALTVSNPVDIVDSHETQITEACNSSIFEPADNTTTELITPAVVNSEIVTTEESIAPILDVNNAVNDPIDEAAEIIEPIIAPELADTNN